MDEDADIRRRARAYCADYLAECTIARPEDGDTLIGLPEPYVVPNREFFEEMYYWDAYFSMLGLRVLGRMDVARGMVENCFHLLDRFGFVPNANRTYYLSRSQPPFLAPMVALIHEATGDEAWLARAVDYLEREYTGYWTEPPHLVEGTGLSRYYDDSGDHEHAEDESGWDLTSRFDKRGTDFLPVDLNSYLYGYERHLGAFHETLGDDEAAATWRQRAERRRERVVDYCWDEAAGLFFDYDVECETHSEVESLAAYVPLWTGLADDDQAAALAANLDRFECPGGVVTTVHHHGMTDRQWNHPEGWAPLQWMTTEGLARYGYDEAAGRLRRRWLGLCEDVFAETGLFWENYDVVEQAVGGRDRRYETQKGFGWSCTVYLAFLAREGDLDGNPPD